MTGRIAAVRVRLRRKKTDRPRFGDGEIVDLPRIHASRAGDPSRVIIEIRQANLATNW